MIDYIKQNHLGLLIIVVLVGSSFFGGNEQEQVLPEEEFLGSSSVSTITNPFTFTKDVITSDDVSLNATTTVARSYDGFMAGGGITPSSLATGTTFTLYTHSGGPALCDSSSAIFYADSTAYSPSLIIDIGTTTTSGGYSANLIASTTLATTTDAVLGIAHDLFVMNSGDQITARLADTYPSNLGASSTNFANWDLEFQTQCWLIGG
jgi:hypothetical protein